MRRPLIFAIAASFTFMTFGAAWATSHLANIGTADQVNSIINTMQPTDSYSEPTNPTYKANVKKVEIPVYASGNSSKIVKTVTVVANYNHTLDIRVFFNYDSARLTYDAQQQLESLGLALSSYELRGSRFLIAGHTDAAGSNSYNKSLSYRRALAVRDYLTENFPIAGKRIVSTGFGEEKLADPLRPNADINRRVEVTLLQEVEPQY